MERKEATKQGLEVTIWGVIELGTSRTECNAPTNCACYDVIMNLTSNWIILKSFQKAFKIFDAFLIVYWLQS